jgi:predicted ester cyclase
MTGARTVERNRRTVETFFAGTHGGNPGVIDQTVAENIVTHGFPQGRNPASRAQYKQFFAEFGAGFSNMSYRTPAWLCDGDKVAVRFEIEVDHTGRYLGLPPTGRRVAFTGIALYRLEEGMIAETWLHLDALAILGQIGATPAKAA